MFQVGFSYFGFYEIKMQQCVNIQKKHDLNEKRTKGCFKQLCDENVTLKNIFRWKNKNTPTLLTILVVNS